MFRALLDKLKLGLTKTRNLFAGVAGLFRLKGKVDHDFLKELEKKLYLADVGSAATAGLVDRMKQAFLDKEIDKETELFVRDYLAGLLQIEGGRDIKINHDGPTVIMIAGVNGSGKTTSIAKLAGFLSRDGKKVLVAACDTFRAAAIDQLVIWCERLGVDIVKGLPGSDPASVAHDACDKARAKGFDFVIVDTAGRLHTQTHLMRELEKIHRVTSKVIPNSPHEVLLVLDATTGQNAVLQAENFQKVVHCTGIILTKLDGTAKGGSIFSIKQRLNIPVKFIGVGEKIEDLESFDPASFVEALFS
ncbi:MAG: signal recognition particle-docking protein FtsY [Planctomycetia bacterium]|jgi:fused signal recognition particle receptor|nr:signal recognition particle-docking protein FtsY [Gemmataceae bacterium]NBT60783.1 signal recognition particle-docking protein FtsY [Planctomycetia bacterium]